MKTVYGLALLFFSLSSQAQSLPKFERFEIDMNAPRTQFFPEIDHVQVIRMEETGNSLLSSLRGYFEVPSGVGIVEKNSIILFDDSGNYKNIINNYGRGPKEYVNISSVKFNKGAIELFSGGSRLMHRYTEEGKYLETIRGKYSKQIRAGSMIPYEEGYIIHELVQSSVAGNSISYYSLIYTDSLLNTVGKGGYIETSNPFPVNLGKRFSSMGESIFYKKILNDSVYQVANGQEYPKFHFDFGKDWAWSEPKNISSHKVAGQVAVNGDKVVEVLVDIGSNLIMLTYYINVRNEEKGHINRKTGVFTRFDMRKRDREKYKLEFIKWEGDRLVSSLSSDDFEEFIDNLNDDQWTVKGGVDLEEILSSENPVLLKIKFRNR